jgi:hypothetical protein
MSPRFKLCSNSGYDIIIRAEYREMSKATDLQQALYSLVIDGRYYVYARKAELKPRDLHQVLTVWAKTTQATQATLE